MLSTVPRPDEKSTNRASLSIVAPMIGKQSREFNSATNPMVPKKRRQCASLPVTAQAGLESAAREADGLERRTFFYSAKSPSILWYRRLLPEEFIRADGKYYSGFVSFCSYGIDSPFNPAGRVLRIYTPVSEDMMQQCPIPEDDVVTLFCEGMINWVRKAEQEGYGPRVEALMNFATRKTIMWSQHP